MKIAQKVAGRTASGLKRFQPIMQAAHARDINESDTVVIITDVLQYVLGTEPVYARGPAHLAPVLDTMRRELRRISPDARIETEEICAVLVNEVLKREVLEGERASAAKRLVARAAGKALRKAQISNAPRSAPAVGELPPIT